MRLTATSAKVGRRFRKVRSGRVKVPFGRRATLRGRLTLSAGQSFAGPDDRRDRGGPQARRPGHAGRQRGHRPPRPLLHQGPRRPQSHLSPGLRRLRRRARRRPRRLGPRAGVEHDPRVAHAHLRPRPRALLRPAAHARPAHPGPRPRAHPPGPRPAGGARSRTPARTEGPLARRYFFQGAPGELPDPRPHPQAVRLPVRARLLATADGSRRLEGAKVPRRDLGNRSGFSSRSNGHRLSA